MTTIEVPAGLDPEVEMEREIDRKNALTYSIAKIVVATLTLFTCWAGYGWPAIFAFMSLISGWIGHSHLRSKEAMYYSECCCSPVSALGNLYHMSYITAVMGVLSVISSVLAAVFMPKHILVVRVFAGINALFCLILTVIETKSVSPLRTLYNVSKVDPTFLDRARRERERAQLLQAQQLAQIQATRAQAQAMYPQLPGTLFGGTTVMYAQPQQQQQLPQQGAVPGQEIYGYPMQAPAPQPAPVQPGQPPAGAYPYPIALQPGQQPPPGMVAYVYPSGQAPPGAQPMGYPPQQPPGGVNDANPQKS